ncbi:MAG: 3D domain-containing protein [candidate division WOR-3 bacterium]|nr:3D domain-containing protein [candidate division WOR-3 bacterium]MCX7757195.1 3D domain-containing protein [candidate division WOR-3 bacterium]MDW7987920.1 3D domain-containing protein [candidate division WOR-3 bacterium]
MKKVIGLYWFLLPVLLVLSCFYRPVIKEPDTQPESKLLFLEVTTPDSAQIPFVPRYKGKFKVTFYWIVEEKDYSGKRDTPIYLENGKLLGYFPRKFVEDFKKESCAELIDGRRISYLKRVNRARIVKEFLGYGGYTIRPFQSVAVDPAVIPLGSKLYIPQLAKVDRASVVAHTNLEEPGVVYAHDIGSMVNNHHIDIFVGYKKNLKLFYDAGITSSCLVDVYLLE